MVLPKEIVEAAKLGDAAAIQVWFSTGTRDPDERDGTYPTTNWNTLLHLAAERGDCDLVRDLLERGATIDAENRHSSRPLHSAAASGRLDAAVLLLERGADLEGRGVGVERPTPLHVAALNEQLDMVRLLQIAPPRIPARSHGC
jgi:ankyrin repeat protein